MKCQLQRLSFHNSKCQTKGRFFIVDILASETRSQLQKYKTDVRVWEEADFYCWHNTKCISIVTLETEKKHNNCIHSCYKRIPQHESMCLQLNHNKSNETRKCSTYIKNGKNAWIHLKSIMYHYVIGKQKLDTVKKPYPQLDPP